MSTVHESQSPAPERLTWAEICARHPNEWVVLVDVDDESEPDPRSGVVLDHGKGKWEALERSLPLKSGYKVAGHDYTGVVRPPRPISPKFLPR